MINKFLKRELKSNEKGHKLFCHQESCDLKELVEDTEIHLDTDLYIDFPVIDWVYDANNIYNGSSNEERVERCQKYVVLKILEQLQKRNKEFEKFEISKFLHFFRNGTKEDFQKIESQLLGVKEVIDLLSFEENHVSRIHFIMNWTTSSILCDALTPFLADDLPFSTSVYMSPNSFYTIVVPGSKDKKYFWDTFEYTEFDGCNEGKKNYVIRNNKRKVKDYNNAKVSKNIY